MQNFLGKTKGAVAILTALLLPVLIGFGAWAIDASLLLYRQERLQIATDIAAHAGAELLRMGESERDVIAFTVQMVEANVDGDLQVVVEVAEQTQVQVTASLGVERILSGILGQGAVRVPASTVAAFDMVPAASNCVYLDLPRQTGALRLRKQSQLTLASCGAVVASTSKTAVKLNTRAVLEASCLTVGGRISGSSGLVLTECSEAEIDAPVSAPPFDDLAAPRPTLTCDGDAGADEEKGKKDKKDKKNKEESEDDDAPVRLEPAGYNSSGLPQMRFCNGLQIDQNTIGTEGLYFVTGGDLEIGENVSLELRSGAILVLQGDVEIQMHATARLSIEAPDHGTYKGVAIIAGHDRAANKRPQHQLGMIEIDGAIVLPAEEIEIDGQSTAAHCTEISAGRLTIAKDARLVISCDAATTTANPVHLLPNL